MIDFSKLGSISPEEERQRELERAERRYAQDEAERDRGSKKAVTITLDEEPSIRATRTGETYAVFQGREDGRSQSLVAQFKLPLRAENEEGARSDFDKRFRDLGGGDRLTLAGSWSKRRWHDSNNTPQERWEFKAQHFAKGDVPLDKMLSRARGLEQPTASIHAARQAARGAGI